MDLKVGTKKEILILSKVDTTTEDEVKEKKDQLEKASGKEVTLLSLYDDESVKQFAETLRNELEK